MGQILARRFHALGHIVVPCWSRNPRPAPWRVVSWDGVTPGEWVADIAQSDVCINLAGRSVNFWSLQCGKSIRYLRVANP